LVFNSSFSQNEEESEIEKVSDTITKTEKYGLRLGVDISQPIISFINEDSKGLEFLADYRVYKNYYAALELGTVDKTIEEDYMNFTTKGSFVKIGANINLYENWKGMSNEIFFGFRYGLSFFDHTLNSYSPNIEGTYFEDLQKTPNTKFNDLTASWFEIVTGLKVETFNNLYLGVSLSIKKMISTKEPENFQNLFVPGFNNVSLNNIGVGFNYSISYLIPVVKKSK
jgi:hypothetical protein